MLSKCSLAENHSDPVRFSSIVFILNLYAVRVSFQMTVKSFICYYLFRFGVEWYSIHTYRLLERAFHTHIYCVCKIFIFAPRKLFHKNERPHRGLKWNTTFWLVNPINFFSYQNQDENFGIRRQSMWLKFQPTLAALGFIK